MLDDIMMDPGHDFQQTQSENYKSYIGSQRLLRDLQTTINRVDDVLGSQKGDKNSQFDCFDDQNSSSCYLEYVNKMENFSGDQLIQKAGVV